MSVEHAGSKEQRLPFEPELKAWLLQSERLTEQPEQLLHGLVGELKRHGFDLLTSSALVRTLHPQFEMLAQRWRPYEVDEIVTETAELLLGQRKVPGPHGVVDVYLLAHGHSQEEIYRTSPFFAVKQTGLPLCLRLDEGETEPSFAIFEDLRARGGTEYLVLPLAMQEPFEASVSFATARAGGFPAGFQASLEVLAPLVGLVMGFSLERLSLRETLRAYLGPSAARRVLAGQVVLGQVQKVNAVIGFADIRRLRRQITDLSDAEHMAVVNDFFRIAFTNITRAHGEILKFIGETVLFVFPLTGGDEASISKQAYEGAQALIQETLNNELIQRHDLGIAVGLHRGEVLLGNVGAPGRLDFTVLGDAVNLAARIQALIGAREMPLAVSAALAADLDCPLRSLGPIELKGIAEPQEVMVPHD